jgi:hypothetical protein
MCAIATEARRGQGPLNAFVLRICYCNVAFLATFVEANGTET